jgi:DNA-directed RNA polymerase specialized sigma24 family protein
MTTRKPFLVRLRDTERRPIEELAKEADVSEAEVARRLLIPAVTLAKQYGLNEVSAELRRQAQEALGLSSGTLRRKVARAKAKLPLKSSPKSGGPKMRFG